MNNLRKTLFIVIIISFGLSLSKIQSVHAQGESKKTLHVVDASSNNFPPMNFLGKDGGLTGFGREMADAVIKEVGGEVEHIHSSQWVEVLNWLETGQADFIHDTGYTQERDQFLDYSDPIIAMPEVIFVRPDEYSINGLDSLKGKTVACVNEHITHLYLKQFPEISVFIVKTPVEGIYELISGKVDAFVYPKQIALYLVQNLRLRDKIKITGKPLRTLSWSMVVKQGNEELLQRLNEGIAKVHKSGQYDRIYKKWWGGKVLSGYTKEQLVILTIMATGISLAVIMSITLLLFSRRLKKRVQEKTISLSREVEERKIIEAKLEAEKEFINAVLENIEDGIVACGKDGVLTLFNRASIEFHNLPEKPIPAEEWAQHYDLFLADGITPMKKEDIPLFRALQGTHVKEMEMVIAPKNGKNRILLASGQPLHDERGELLGAVVTMNDITERKYAEAELQKANAVLDIKVQERTRELLKLSENLSKEIDERKKSEDDLALSKMEHEEAQQIAQIGHWALDLSADDLTWSDEVFRIFKLKKGEKPTYEYFLSIIHPDDKDDVNNAFYDSVKNKTDYDITHRLLFNDGSIKYVHEQGKTYCDQIGTPYRSMGTVQDISLQKTIEDEKEQLMQKLEQSQRMEAIGTLAGGIAHDFNNILTPIIGYTELVMGALPQGSAEVSMLHEVKDAGIRAKELVKQILSFSRKSEQEKVPLKITVIVKEALKLLRSSIPTSIDIKQDIDENCGPVMCDATQIHQVMMNLATNAYHAMMSDGGVLEVSMKGIALSEEESKLIENLPMGKYVRIIVSDTGQGIDPKTLDKIFDPYFTTKETGEGTGLGLSVVLGIVKDHGGHIKVYSEKEQGTTFAVYLPEIKTQEKNAHTEEVGALPLGNERILLVDDEEAITTMLTLILERLGYKVTSKIDSIEALECFRENPSQFDLVITDQTMPHISGSELAKRMLEIRSNIPIILCTGYSSLISKEKTGALGVRHFLMKPVMIPELAKTIRKVLGDK